MSFQSKYLDNNKKKLLLLGKIFWGAKAPPAPRSLRHCYRQNTEAVVQSCFVKKVFLEFRHNSQENTCARVFFNKVAGLRLAPLLKKRLARVFSCKFCEISKNIFFYRTHLVAASENKTNITLQKLLYIVLEGFQFFFSKKIA